MLGDITRTSVASLALALGFAGLSEVGKSGFSLLGELQATWFRLQSRRPGRLRRADRIREDQDDVLRMHQGEEDDLASDPRH